MIRAEHHRIRRNMLASGYPVSDSGKRKPQLHAGMSERVESTLPFEEGREEKTEGAGDRDIGEEREVGDGGPDGGNERH
jgi:hypothetical protein